ncbi:MAG: hypothetical protein EA385_16935 [Salinarimonadaceae bacterium]|nr:MAG: hypothetical protein EA385_16935 [Salinarimonadaceae bacterium]
MSEPILDPISAAIDAAKARLEPYFSPEVWHYSERSEVMGPREFEDLLSKTPHLAFAWAGWRSDGKGTLRYQGALALRIWIVVRNPRMPERFRGDKLGPGLYPAVLRVVQALQGAKLADVGSARVTNVAPAFADGFVGKDNAVALVELEIPTHLGDLVGAVGDAPDFLGLQVDWELARAEGVATAPDAQDEITLQTPPEEDA